MHFFDYKNDELYAEEVPVISLAREYGTPLFVYSHKTLTRHIRAYKDAFVNFPHVICFALKANSNSALLRIFYNEGCGADIVSGGELFRAVRAGISPDKIVYAGVGKKSNEIEAALKHKILMFNVESEQEMTAINDIAEKLGVKAPVALRVNPDIDPKTHEYISTGLKKNKFGIPFEKAVEYYDLAKGLKNIEIVGIHKHIGSQITTIEPFIDSLKRILVLIDNLKDKGINISYLDIGGGLGIKYENENPPHPSELAESLTPLLKGRDITIVLEPGRSMVGNAGILVSQALYTKKTEEKDFIVTDAGMNDLMRPTLYHAFHNIFPVIRRDSNMRIYADVVGPICETGDFLARDRELQKLDAGDYLAVMSAGAYGYAMSSNYNSRPRAAEVLVKGSEYFPINRRETYEDLVKGEIIPEFLT